MKLINDLKNYIVDKELKINILKNKVNIVNYKNIDHFDLEKIIINHDEGIIIIKGDNLVVSKLLDDEILIEGVISNIELR